MAAKMILPPSGGTHTMSIRVHTWALDVAQEVAKRQSTYPSTVLGAWIDEMATRVKKTEAKNGKVL